MLNLLIKNALVLDGTGAEAFAADVAVENGMIQAVGRFPYGNAAQMVDAASRYLTPGFIDIHRHGDMACLRPGAGELELRQGLTTVINGNCGLSAAPMAGDFLEDVQAYLRPVTGAMTQAQQCATMKQYLERIRQTQPMLHYGMLAGMGTIRAMTAGFGVERLEDGHYRQIHRILEQCLEQGARGVSLGLGYAPECFYTTDELIRALAPLSGGKIPVTVHLRDECDGVVDALKEMLHVAKVLNLPLQVSHLKAIGRRNWQRLVPEMLALLDQVRQEGLRVGFDVYPYTAGSTQMLHILPPEFLLGGPAAICQRLADPVQRERLRERIENDCDFGNIAQLVGWENIYAFGLTKPDNLPLEGLSIACAAEQTGRDPFHLACDLLQTENCGVTMIDYITDEADVAAILQADGCSVISDSTYPTGAKPHPRLHGTFVRVLERYAGENGVLSLPEAVAKMTSVPAQALGLQKKGEIRVGFDADLVLFDHENLREAGTFADPDHSPEGIDWVFVKGKAALSEGKLTGIRAGTIL